MIEVLQAIYNYFKNDDGKDDKGNWLDMYDHRTYAEILGTDANNFHKHFIPTRQPRLLENVPLVTFYIIDMPPHRALDQFFKIVTMEFDIYTKDATLEENLKVARRHFQLLQGKIIPSERILPYFGRWYHQTEMALLLVNPNLYCYAQRFVVAVKREYLVTKKKI